MLTFKNITVRNAAMLRRYYENCDYALCEYSAGVKLMWRSALRYAWAEAAGCLIIRCESEGRVSFDYPVAGPDGDEDAALSAIEAYCMETGIQPEISIVPEEKAPVLLSRYPYVRVRTSAPGGTTCTTRRISSSSPGGDTPASGTTSKSSTPNGPMRSSGPLAPRRTPGLLNSSGWISKRNFPRTAAARPWQSWNSPKR